MLRERGGEMNPHSAFIAICVSVYRKAIHVTLTPLPTHKGEEINLECVCVCVYACQD